MLNPRITVGVSLKAYFRHHDAVSWLNSVARIASETPSVRDGIVEVFIAPTYLQLHHALSAFAGTPVRVAAQDVSDHEPGAATGEVTAAELREIGVTLAEVGHAERRARHGETDEIVAAKVAVALRHGITPIICLGESERSDPARAADTVCHQLATALRDAPAGRVMVAYEPVWAIGARTPAPHNYIRHVTGRLRDLLSELSERDASSVLYGGSAGVGLLAELGNDVDGIFLGRFAHDPAVLEQVLAEATELSARLR